MTPEKAPEPESGVQPPIAAGADKRAVLDTTIQLDRIKTAGRREHLEGVLGQFGLTFATSMSLVEFKATLIEQCITIHNQLRRKGARFTRARDALLEKDHLQRALRTHIFNNLLNIYGSSHEVTDEEDQRLAEKARLKLENDIPRLYRWFTEESTDAILRDRLECNRAKEPPRKKEAAFDTNLPICKRAKNKTCKVEEVLRQESTALLPRLRELAKTIEQFQKTIGVIEKAADPSADFSHRECRGAGDTLIALEAKNAVTHAVSTNAREWQPLSSILELEFVHVTYPDEQTR